MKKVILLSVVLITGIPISCDFFGTTSGSSFFRIEELAISVGQFENNSLSRFQEREFDPAPSDTLSASDLVIEIRIEQTSVVASAKSNWFIPSAFADQVQPIADSKLSLISIYSDESIFSDGIEYKAGENLTDLFSIKSSPFDTGASILKFIQEFNTWYSGDRLFLMFSAPIDQPLAQSLRIDVTLENGTVFNLESAKIVVK